MAGRTLWCTKCKAGYASVGEIPAACPHCDQPTTGALQWWTSRQPWVLSVNDKRFLRSIRIAPQDDASVRRR
jgi:hypothetical protein